MSSACGHAADEILNGAQHRKQHGIGRGGSRAAQLRLEALRAELLIGVIARLEDAVGVSQQHVAGAQFHASSRVGGRRDGAEQRSTFGKQFQLPVRSATAAPEDVPRCSSQASR